MPSHAYTGDGATDNIVCEALQCLLSTSIPEMPAHNRRPAIGQKHRPEMSTGAGVVQRGRPSVRSTCESKYVGVGG